MIAALLIVIHSRILNLSHGDTRHNDLVPFIVGVQPKKSIKIQEIANFNFFDPKKVSQSLLIQLQKCI